MGSGPEVDTICLSPPTLRIRIKAEEMFWRERREEEVLGEGGGEADFMDVMESVVEGEES